MYGHKALLLTDAVDQPVILDWWGEDEFQLSLHGGPQPCHNLGRGLIGEWVYFTRSGIHGDVTSFSIPGLAYSVVYTRL